MNRILAVVLVLTSFAAACSTTSTGPSKTYGVSFNLTSLTPNTATVPVGVLLTPSVKFYIVGRTPGEVIWVGTCFDGSCIGAGVPADSAGNLNYSTSFEFTTFHVGSQVVSAYASTDAGHNNVLRSEDLKTVTVK